MKRRFRGILHGTGCCVGRLISGMRACFLYKIMLDMRCKPRNHHPHHPRITKHFR